MASHLDFPPPGQATAPSPIASPTLRLAFGYPPPPASKQSGLHLPNLPSLHLPKHLPNLPHLVNLLKRRFTGPNSSPAPFLLLLLLSSLLAITGLLLLPSGNRAGPGLLVASLAVVVWLVTSTLARLHRKAGANRIKAKV